LMCLLCRIFNRVTNKNKHLLEPSQMVEKAMADFNARVMKVYNLYLQSFAKSFGWELGEDDTLPLSRLRIAHRPVPYQTKSIFAVLAANAIPVYSRSLFASLSNPRDSFEDLNDMVASMRSGIFVDSSTIPRAQGSSSISSYLLAFYTTGDLLRVATEYNMSEAILKKQLDEFGRIVKKIATSLKIHGPNDDSLVQTFQELVHVHFPCYECRNRGHMGYNCVNRSLGRKDGF